MSTARAAAGVIAAVGVVAAAPAAWWLSGLGPNGVAEELDPDYLRQPLDLSSRAAAAIGIGACVIVGGALALTAWSMRDGRLLRRWWGVMLPWIALAAYVGTTYRVATTPVIGANIGAGLMIFGAIPFAVAMIVHSGFTRRGPGRS